MTVVDGDREQRLEAKTEAPQPRLRRNDYSPLRPPEVGAWQPVLDVSVVIPARGAQDKLDLVLAALAAQTYPAHLVEVVVVDDASDPPLALPEIRPENTKLVSAEPGGWGSGHAVNTGAAASDGAVILRLDADMIAYRDHVESQMRWHHEADYLAVLGHKLFTRYTPGQIAAREVHEAVRDGAAAELFDSGSAEAHWTERFIDRHDGLRDAGHMAYHVFVGATGSLRRDVFTAAGGMNPSLALGGDAEFAYRVAQAGAVFIPDTGSSSWHLGRSQMQSRRDEGTAYRDPYLANRIPLLESRRRTKGRQWKVPYVDVVIDCGGAAARQARETVEAFLVGDTTDIRIILLGDFAALNGERRAPLDEPLLDLRLIHEAFHSEPRVRFGPPASPQPGTDALRAQPSQPAEDAAATFRLDWPVACRPASSAIAALTEAANTQGAGLVRAVPPASQERANPPRLERASAFARAHRVGGSKAAAGDLDAVVDQVYGVHWMDGAGEVFAAGEHEPEAPADWQDQLREWQKRAENEKKRADRLERRIRWATRAQPKRVLRRLLLGPTRKRR